MRPASLGAAVTVTAVGLGLFAGSAAGASITQVAPAPGAEVYSTPGARFTLTWRTDLSGCAQPVSQGVELTPSAGTSILNLVGPSPSATAARGRQAVRFARNATKEQVYGWTVTLTCADGSTVSETRAFRLRPRGPKLLGTYVFPRRARITRWRAMMTLCGSRACRARVNAGFLKLRLRSTGRISPVVYRGGGSRRFDCRAADGSIVPRGIRQTVTIRRATVLSTIVRGQMTIAKRIRVEARVVEKPMTRTRTGDCSPVAFSHNDVAVRR